MGGSWETGEAAQRTSHRDSNGIADLSTLVSRAPDPAALVRKKSWVSVDRRIRDVPFEVFNRRMTRG
jgi:hypothetical protein